MPNSTPLRLLPPAARSSRTAPHPSLLTAAGRYDTGAVMRLAHDLARDDVADAARCDRNRRYKIALRDALSSAWISARAQRDCATRDAAVVAAATLVDVGNLGRARPTAPATISSAINPDLHRVAEGRNVPDIRADPHVALRPPSVGTPPTGRGPFHIIRASDEVEQVSLPA